MQLSKYSLLIVLVNLMTWLQGFAVLAAEKAKPASWFHQLITLRFAEEVDVRTYESGFVNTDSMTSSNFLHVKGKALFFPGEFLDLRFYTKDELRQLAVEKNAIEADLKLRPFPYPMNETDLTYGTFVVYVEQSGKKDLWLFPQRSYQSAENYVITDSGESTKISEIGKLNKDPGKNNDWLEPPSLVSGFTTSGDFIYLSHVSSPIYKGKNTLNLSTFLLGEEDVLYRSYQKTIFFGQLIVGAFFLMAIFYGFIFAFRPKDRSSLYLSGYASTLFVISVIMTGILPIVDTVEMPRLFSFLNTQATSFLELFLLHKIRPVISRKWYLRGVGFCGLLYLNTIFAQMYEIPPMVAFGFVGTLVFSVYLNVAMIYYGYKYRLDAVNYFVAGAIGAQAFQLPVLMIAVGGGSGEYGFGVVLSHLVMAVSLALVNAKEFAITYHRSIKQAKDLEVKNEQITFFNKNLEKLVAQKTEQIRVLLDYIPQGVLSLENEGVISKEYSAHLESIIGSEQIADKSFLERFLRLTNLSRDEQDQVWQSIYSSIGESDLTWEVNMCHLPRELVFIDSNGDEKVLKATWNVKLENDEVHNVLVTLLDVTHEKLLERTAEEQRKEMEIIQQLISAPAINVAQFFSSSEKLINENMEILQTIQQIESSHIRLLFVNAHTVKGAARTLGLKGIAAAIHDAEEAYTAILRQSVSLNVNKLKSDLEEVISVVKNYIDINQQKLNRGDELNRVSLDRHFIENHQSFLEELIKDPERPVSHFIRFIKEQNQVFQDLVFEKLSDVVGGYQMRAAKIAKDLGKSEPSFKVAIEDMNISRDLQAVLDNCMIHLLRNSLDHGIESDDERITKGKPAAGEISIDVKCVEDRIVLRICDDGRGIAMGKLRLKGMEQGIITSESSLEEVAEVIFASGLSTAEKVSSISGRGVGMEAVRSYLGEIGGTVTIHVLEPKDEACDYYNFYFEIDLPLAIYDVDEAA